jgi:hypothetical protein
MKFNRESLAKAGAVATAAMLPMFAHADAFTLPTEVTDAKAAVLLVGAGVFAIAVGIKLYKWITRAL